LQRKTGRLTGWVGYTLSWAELQFDEVNFGEKYFARYDRRHDISVVAVYEINERIIFSGTWVYGTGNAITLPIGEYQASPHNFGQNNEYSPGYWWRNVNDYGGINNSRMAPYHRLDLGIQFIKQHDNWRGVWEISAYNAYNRKNPFFYYIGYTGNEERALMQVSIFPIIPSISYSAKF
jgi:hypothetical protein